ncbi:50S ribosomal protein L6 [Eikenella sp. S3360]|uniref:Large ribosomal subunit protein uL6 n=1 Tax=Eikenella glucosivorans TaxID=2766967 RepID=A0ABS0NCM0_9NEIS|nr:50S ribosomal protein L6 [Eikenella glucosivorans]MBH5330048.1 50S ribosomal protein L6 [Eikenella glucosivorans]
MSRIAKSPVAIPAGVDVKVNANKIVIKNKDNELVLNVPYGVSVQVVDGHLEFSVMDDKKESNALSGTIRAIAANMVQGVLEGFEKKLQLVGVGYRAQAQGNILNLSLGFSHPIAYEMPKGVVVQTPSPTEIVLKGSNKQVIGQVAAEIRAFRPPEPYKGKGVRYVDEVVMLKEAKKK